MLLIAGAKRRLVLSDVKETPDSIYFTGRLLGRGTYAIVREATHLETGEVHACKIINKKLVQGKEDLVRNEIAVLKHISGGNPKIVTLQDYFETAHNLCLCFDLCSGGELFDRITSRGSYYEKDAAALVRTIILAAHDTYSAGSAHRDIKPENPPFRTKADDADIMIADFGLSRLMDESEASMLTEICGTPGYMVPEIFRRQGHGKPMDIYSIGVVTYFLLVGYQPFSRATSAEENKARIAGDYKFEPKEYWVNISGQARSFVQSCLAMDLQQRPTAREALERPWFASAATDFVTEEAKQGGPKDLLPSVKKALSERVSSWSLKRGARMVVNSAISGVLLHLAGLLDSIGASRLASPSAKSAQLREFGS
ncbi:Pkinase-domain-containing protein [Mycena olivaceomarginata]|nr:Pkinase-domain-containing protein [Mycena olivaceomarginata]